MSLSSTPLRTFLQQPFHADIVKVGLADQVETRFLPLSYCFRHSLDRVGGCPLGAISYDPGWQSASNTGSMMSLSAPAPLCPESPGSTDADFCPVFRYLLLRLGVACQVAPVQFVAQLLEQSSTPCASVASNVTRLFPGPHRFVGPRIRARGSPSCRRGRIAPPKNARTVRLRLDVYPASASGPANRWTPIHLVLAFLRGRHANGKGPLRSTDHYFRSSLRRPAATSLFGRLPVSPLSCATLLRRFRSGTRRASPVAHMSLSPCRRFHPQPR